MKLFPDIDRFVIVQSDALLKKLIWWQKVEARVKMSTGKYL